MTLNISWSPSSKRNPSDALFGRKISRLRGKMFQESFLRFCSFDDEGIEQFSFEIRKLSETTMV